VPRCTRDSRSQSQFTWGLHLTSWFAELSPGSPLLDLRTYVSHPLVASAGAEVPSHPIIRSFIVLLLQLTILTPLLVTRAFHLYSSLWPAGLAFDFIWVRSFSHPTTSLLDYPYE